MQYFFLHALPSPISMSEDTPLFPNKINRPHQQYKPHEMVPFQRLVLKKHQSKNGKHHQRDNLLCHLELDKTERAAVFDIPHFVGGHHEAIFKKSDEPTGQNKAEQARLLEKFEVLELEVAVPSKGHKDIGEDQKGDGLDTFHVRVAIIAAKVAVIGSYLVTNASKSSYLSVQDL
jgi:uncharacterized protein (UPF0335 family)